MIDKPNIRIGAVVTNNNPYSAYNGRTGQVIGFNLESGFFVHYEGIDNPKYPKIVGYDVDNLGSFSLKQIKLFSFMEECDGIIPLRTDLYLGKLLYRNNINNQYYPSMIGEVTRTTPEHFTVKYSLTQESRYLKKDLGSFYVLTENNLLRAKLNSSIKNGDIVRKVGISSEKLLKEFPPLEGRVLLNYDKESFELISDDGVQHNYPLWCLHKLFELAPKQDKTNQPKEQKIMSDDKSATITQRPSAGVLLKQDAIDATYRVTAKQMSKAVRLGLISLLEKKGMEKSKLDVLNEMLSSDAGLAATSELLGWGLEYLPIDRIQQSEQAKLLAKEFRVEGLAVGGNLLMDALRDNLLPTVLEQLDKLPRPEKVRIEEPKEDKVRLTSLKDTEEVESIAEEAEQNTSKTELR